MQIVNAVNVESEQALGDQHNFYENCSERCALMTNYIFDPILYIAWHFYESRQLRWKKTQKATVASAHQLSFQSHSKLNANRSLSFYVTFNQNVCNLGVRYIFHGVAIHLVEVSFPFMLTHMEIYLQFIMWRISVKTSVT